MKLYSEDKNYKIYQGSMLDMLEVIEPSSIDAIVCDPPYELNFMNKGWDNSGIAFQKDTWRKCYDVLKSGGYLLAFGGTRTYHRIACAIEDAGFEIRDCIMWLYGSGFPKSLNIGLAIDKKMGVESEIIGQKNPHLDGGLRKHTSPGQFLSGNENRKYVKETNNGLVDVVIPKSENGKQWQGWGTALKPAYEPIIVARKPCDGSTTDNVIKYGVGGINIDECRIYNEEEISCHNTKAGTFAGKTQTIPKFRKTGLSFGQYEEKAERIEYTQHEGRFPSNVILTYDDSDYDEVCAGMPTGGKNGSISKNYKINNQVYGDYGFCNTFEAYDDFGSASRYFYCAKASKKDRDNGLDMFEEMQVNDGRNTPIDNAFQRGESLRKNTHPTVKPVELMQYLVRLVTPKGGVVLDCFLGSGSTGKAVMFENRERNANYKFIGIELTDEYLPIAKARIDYAKDIFEYELKQKKKEGQLNIFDFMGEEEKNV